MNFKNRKQRKWPREITKTLVELYELQPVLYNVRVVLNEIMAYYLI